MADKKKKSQKKKANKYKGLKKLKKVINSIQGHHVESELASLLQPADAEYITNSLARIRSSEILSDPLQASKEIGELEERFKTAITNVPLVSDRRKAINLINGTDAIGYEPAGSLLRRLYPNPFAVFAFLGDNYWAAVRARRMVRVEIETDGYNFISMERTSQKMVKAAYRALEDLKLLQVRTELIDHLNLFGNAWLKPIRNLFGGIMYFEVLLPERMLPIWDRNSDKLIGWQYHVNNTRFIYSVDELVHLKTYSTRSQFIGSPGLASVVVDMEAAMFASLFNNTVFQKGGMIGNIISLKGMEPASLINENNFSLLADAVQARFDKKYAGVRGAGQTIVSPFVDKVFKMMSIGEMDGSFKTMTESTDKKVSQLLCCAPEKLGIPMTSQYTDKGQVADRITASFDNEVYYLSTIVDSAFNLILEAMFGITQVSIQSGSAYKADSVAAGQYGELMAKIGGVMTVDEFRTQIMKKEPWGGSLGRRLLDNSRNRDMVSTGEGGSGAAPSQLGPDLPSYNFGKQSVIHQPRYIKNY